MKSKIVSYYHVVYCQLPVQYNRALYDLYEVTVRVTVSHIVLSLLSPSPVRMTSVLGSPEGILSTTDLFPLSSDQKPVSTSINIFQSLRKNRNGENTSQDTEGYLHGCLPRAGTLLSGG